MLLKRYRCHIVIRWLVSNLETGSKCPQTYVFAPSASRPCLSMIMTFYYYCLVIIIIVIHNHSCLFSFKPGRNLPGNYLSELFLNLICYFINKISFEMCFGMYRQLFVLFRMHWSNRHPFFQICISCMLFLILNSILL